MKEDRLCAKHGMTNFLLQSNGAGGKAFRCAKCNKERGAKSVAEKKDRAYALYGNACSVCGYDKCRQALEWHHVDPSQKEMNPSAVFSRTWERIMVELKKCVLLCANCHREVHFPSNTLGV